MFKRRPRSYPKIAQEFFYPRGGWGRAAQYVLHRLRRLPDPPGRIGRGVAAGVFVSFTPLFGAHFLAAAATAWAIGGNILAALLATFIGNPLTTPFIAVLCVTLGRQIMGLHGHIGPQAIVGEIGRATGELASNVLALVGPRDAEWVHLARFAHEIFVPYFVGGLIPGLLAGAASHFVAVRLTRLHQRRRAEAALRRRAAAGGRTAPQ